MTDAWPAGSLAGCDHRQEQGIAISEKRWGVLCLLVKPLKEEIQDVTHDKCDTFIRVWYPWQLADVPPDDSRLAARLIYC